MNLACFLTLRMNSSLIYTSENFVVNPLSIIRIVIRSAGFIKWTRRQHRFQLRNTIRKFSLCILVLKMLYSILYRNLSTWGRRYTLDHKIIQKINTLIFSYSYRVPRVNKCRCILQSKVLFILKKYCTLNTKNLFYMCSYAHWMYSYYTKKSSF